MEQRISLVTLGVADLARARAFYEALGWSGAKQPDGAGLKQDGQWSASGPTVTCRAHVPGYGAATLDPCPPAMAADTGWGVQSSRTGCTLGR